MLGLVNPVTILSHIKSITMNVVGRITSGNESTDQLITGDGSNPTSDYGNDSTSIGDVLQKIHGKRTL